MTSRRLFLHHAASLAALGLLGRGPVRRLCAQTPNELFADGPDEAMLRALALVAVDAARQAGATFADVRLRVGHTIQITSDMSSGSGVNEEAQGKPVMLAPSKSSSVQYDVRALVNGAWGIVADYDLSQEAIVRAARTAVAVAKFNRPRHRKTLDIAPAPVIPNGRWATPIERDPFDVPMREQGDLQLAVLETGSKIPGITQLSLNFRWDRALNVFASTEGSMIAQDIRSGGPGAGVGCRVGLYNLGSLLTRVTWEGGGHGYEVVADQKKLTTVVTDEARSFAETIAASRNPVEVDVGRYDLVLDAASVANAVTSTLVPALNLERVLGYHANREGTSFAAPPRDMLGKYRVGSPLVTLRGDRTTPHDVATIGWDEEGVVPEPHTVIREGIITDYHTSRQTAVELAGLDGRQGKAVRSNGCTRSTPQGPAVCAPNLVLEPSKDSTTVDDLIADTKRGLFIEFSYCNTDQQLINNQLSGIFWNVRRITNGKLGPYIRHLATQFITTGFWKSLDSLGGAASVRRVLTSSSDPSVRDTTIRVPAARFRQVNVFSTGRTA